MSDTDPTDRQEPSLAHQLQEARTEMARLEACLAESTNARAAHQAEIFESTPAVQLLIEREGGRVIDANNAACSFYGYSRSELMALRIWDLSTLGEAETRRQMASVEASKPTEFALQHRLASGEIRDVAVYTGQVKSLGDDLLHAIVFDTSARVSAERALKAQKDFFEQVFVQSCVSTQILDRDGWCERINPKLSEIFHVRPEDIEGRRYNIFEDEAVRRGGVLPHLERVFRDRKMAEWVVHFDLAVASESTGVPVSDARKVWYANRAYPILDETGQLTHVIVQHTDISDQKAAEESIQTLSRAVEQGPASIMIADPAGIIEYVNPCFERVTGYTKAEAIGRNPRFLKSGQTPQAVYAELWKAISEGGEWRGELCNRRKNGKLYWEHAAISGLKDSSGKIVHYIAVKSDITERKRVEAALVNSRRVLEQVQHLSHVGSWELDVDTATMVASPEGHRIYGLEDAVVLLGAVQAVVLPEYRVALDEALTGCVAGTAKYDVEFKIRRANDGAIRDIYSVAEYDAERRRVTGFIQDVTERRRAEEERGRLEEQLRQAQKMESIGRLAGGVAHDFNNMLGVILGHVDLALEEADPSPTLREDLEEVRTAAIRSADLTRQLLAFARKQTISPKVLDLNATVDGTLKLLRRLVGENVNVEWAPQEGLWPVSADPSQIDQILANLCVNARDAIVGVGTMRIETGNASLSEEEGMMSPDVALGDYVRIVVRDDGCGMDEATLEQIFEPFFTTKAVGKGTGLGLSTVYGIVKQNLGHIGVESEPGRGTTFTIYWPRHVAVATTPKSSTAKPPARQNRETILVVEDERAMLRLAKRVLERAGYTVLAASSPTEALLLARDHPGPIDVLLADVLMPEMNGRDLADRVAAMRPGVRQVFMSGHTADVISEQGVVEDGVHFLHKPFSQRDLEAKLREVLDGPAP
jgi:PAS domain S-box-containing protein